MKSIKTSCSNLPKILLRNQNSKKSKTLATQIKHNHHLPYTRKSNLGI